MNKTCKDCIHSDICLKQYEGLNQERMLKECKKFKDKDRFIELPCAVGDTVYSIVCDEIQPFVVVVSQIQLVGKETSFEYKAENGEYPAFFSGSSIGRTVFLTKEDAEKALSKEFDYVKAKDFCKDCLKFKAAVKRVKRL